MWKYAEAKGQHLIVQRLNFPCPSELVSWKDQESNQVCRTLKHNEEYCKKFWYSSNQLDILHNYFDSPTKFCRICNKLNFYVSKTFPCVESVGEHECVFLSGASVCIFPHCIFPYIHMCMHNESPSTIR